MYSKLCLLALAVAARAAADGAKPYYPHEHHHGHHHHSGGIFPPSGSVAPFPTGGSSQAVGPTGTAAGSATGAGPEPTGDTTLTYTITANGQPTTVTTTIHHTNYHTDFVYAHQSEAPEEKNVDNGGSVTQTIHITSTSTHFITEYASATSAAAPEEKVVAPASGAGTGGCAVQQTVTIQGPEVTVTVTAPAEVAATTGGIEDKMPKSEAQGPGSEVPPYPLPSSKKSKTKCASTGFITKSAKATATGVLPTGSGGLKYPSGTAPIEKVRKHKN